MEKAGNIKTIHRILRFCLYAASGFLCAFPLVFGSWWITAWIAPVPVLFCEFFSDFPREHRFFKAWARGLLFFFCYSFVAFSWFASIYPIDYLGYSRADAIIVIVLAMTGLPLIQAAVSAFVFVYISAVRERVNKYIVFIGCAFLWAVAEWMQTLTFAGVPWGRMAVGQAENKAVIQSASLFGSYFVTFIIILTACFLADCAHRFVLSQRKRSLISFIVAIGIFSLNLGYGSIKINTSDYSGENVKVAALQGNILFEDKYYLKEDYIMDTYRELTMSAANDGAGLILWPETAIPCDFEEDDMYADYLTDLQTDADCVIMAGFFRQDGDRLYNSVFPVTEKGISREYYSKRHLVPFGEYVPYEDLINMICPPLGRFAAIDYPLSAGDDACVFGIPCGRVSCLVCFDSIYEDLSLEAVRDGSQLLLVSTNDSWFSGSPALRQHNLQTALRCVETGRYAVRAANTGISSVITPNGEITSSLGDGERGYIIDEVKMITDMTLYDSVGNIIIPIGIGFAFLTVIAALLRKKDGNNNK